MSAAIEWYEFPAAACTWRRGRIGEPAAGDRDGWRHLHGLEASTNAGVFVHECDQWNSKPWPSFSFHVEWAAEQQGQAVTADALDGAAVVDSIAAARAVTRTHGMWTTGHRWCVNWVDDAASNRPRRAVGRIRGEQSSVIVAELVHAAFAPAFPGEEPKMVSRTPVVLVALDLIDLDEPDDVRRRAGAREIGKAIADMKRAPRDLRDVMRSPASRGVVRYARIDQNKNVFLFSSSVDYAISVAELMADGIPFTVAVEAA